MSATEFDPRDHAAHNAAHNAEELKRETDFAIEIDKQLEQDAYDGGMADDEVRKALFLLIVTTLTYHGWSVDMLCSEARAAAVPARAP